MRSSYPVVVITVVVMIIIIVVVFVVVVDRLVGERIEEIRRKLMMDVQVVPKLLYVVRGR